MSSFRRRMMMRKAKPYDAEVTYLKGDGQAYIDLKTILISNRDVINISFGNSLVTSSAQGIFGARNDVSTLNYSAIIGSTGYAIIDINNTNYEQHRLTSSETCITELCTMHLEQSYKSIIINEVKNESATISTSFSTSISANLFKVNNFGRTSEISLYSFNWIRDGVLLFDLIPVRKGNVGYLYDKVSNKLFGNSNSIGAFIYGEDVI